MKKCLLMFAFFLIALLIAALTDDGKNIIQNNDLVGGENRTELLLANGYTSK